MTAPVPARIQVALTQLAATVSEELRRGAEATRVTLDEARKQLREMQETMDSAEAAVETASPRLLRTLTEILDETGLAVEDDDVHGSTSDVINRTAIICGEWSATKKLLAPWEHVAGEPPADSLGVLIDAYGHAAHGVLEAEQRRREALRYEEDANGRAERWRDQAVETEERRREHVARCEAREEAMVAENTKLRDELVELHQNPPYVTPLSRSQAGHEWVRLADNQWHHVVEAVDERGGATYVDGRAVAGTFDAVVIGHVLRFDPLLPDLDRDERVVLAADDERWRWWVERKAES